MTDTTASTLDLAVLAILTGGDPINARRLHRQERMMVGDAQAARRELHPPLNLSLLSGNSEPREIGRMRMHSEMEFEEQPHPPIRFYFYDQSHYDMNGSRGKDHIVCACQRSLQ